MDVCKIETKSPLILVSYIECSKDCEDNLGISKNFNILLIIILIVYIIWIHNNYLSKYFF